MSRDVDDGPRRGRPIDPGVAVALRAATFAVLAEHGWRGTTVERIAVQARVARTTVYRRYGSVHGVMLMLLDEVYTFGPTADTGSLRGDLVQTARAVQAMWTAAGHTDYLSAMTAARRESPEVERAMLTRHDAVHAALRPILERAEVRGELRAGPDPALLLELVCSVVIQRAIHDDAPKPSFPEQVVDAALTGFAS